MPSIVDRAGWKTCVCPVRHREYDGYRNVVVYAGYGAEFLLT
jgi:hypothetical protein